LFTQNRQADYEEYQRLRREYREREKELSILEEQMQKLREEAETHAKMREIISARSAFIKRACALG
jgi:hypothetical protein